MMLQFCFMHETLCIMDDCFRPVSWDEEGIRNELQMICPVWSNASSLLSVFMDVIAALQHESMHIQLQCNFLSIAEYD